MPSACEKQERYISKRLITDGIAPRVKAIHKPAAPSVAQESKTAKPVTPRRRRSKIKIKPTAYLAYLSIFIVIIVVVAIGYQPASKGVGANKIVSSAAVVPTVTPEAATSDTLTTTGDLKSVKVALAIATEFDMPVEVDVANLVTTLTIKDQMNQYGSVSSIVKPDVLESTDDSRVGIVKYKVERGDTVASVAKKFNVSEQTLRWANDLTPSATIKVGKTLSIPPTNGVLYTVRYGDTLNSLARTYKADKDRIVTLNNLELGGLKPGAKIIIPDGNLPETERPGYVAPVQQQQQSYLFALNYGALNSSIFTVIGYGVPGHNIGRYADGNCTAYAYARRAQMGMPIGDFWGNANQWLGSARAAGYRTGLTPTVGAVAYWNSYQGGSGWAGHVAVVEAVNGNRVTISEMNAFGYYNTITQRTIDAGGVSAYIYTK